MLCYHASYLTPDEEPCWETSPKDKPGPRFVVVNKVLLDTVTLGCLRVMACGGFQPATVRSQQRLHGLQNPKTARLHVKNVCQPLVIEYLVCISFPQLFLPPTL